LKNSNHSFIKNLSETLRQLIFLKENKILTLILENRSIDFNKINISIEVLNLFDAQYKRKVNLSLIEYALIYKNDDVISLLNKNDNKKYTNYLLSNKYKIINPYQVKIINNKLMTKKEAILISEKFAKLTKFNINNKNLIRFEILTKSNNVISCFKFNSLKNTKKCINNKKGNIENKFNMWIIYYKYLKRDKVNQTLEDEFFIIINALNGNLKDLSDKHGEIWYQSNPFHINKKK